MKSNLSIMLFPSTVIRSQCKTEGHGSGKLNDVTISISRETVILQSVNGR